MSEYVFESYVHGGREYFVYGERDDLARVNFPFPQSLLLMLDLNPAEINKLTHPIERKIEAFYAAPMPELEAEIMAGLDELAGLHIYFAFVRLDWKRRFERARRNGYASVMDDLPRKQIGHIHSEFQVLQQQIKTLFHEVLYFEDDRDAIPERLVAYYERAVEFPRDRYEFRPCPVSYELVAQGVFTDVLHPASVYDLIGFAVSKCVKRKLRMRVCESCGRWFALTGRITATYCNLPREGRETGCRGLAAVKKWTENKKENEVFTEYRREYKRRFAWIRLGRIAADDFYAWSEQARMREADCERGDMTLDEFRAWLKRE